MKVYVDELPKNCNDCQFLVFVAYHQNGFLHRERYCPLRKDGNCNCSKENCPLQSLAEHDKEVRKEVIEELVDMVGDYWTVPMGKVVDYDGTEIDAFITGADFDEIITRMEKGE